MTQAGEIRIEGHVAPGFEPVRDAFVGNFTHRREIGGACCVYFRGEKVVDLWGGVRNEATGEPWCEDTMVLVYSATKGLAAMTLALAHSRGWLDYEQRVAVYWPEFAQQGKENITVRQLLSHQAGLFAFDGQADRDLVADPVVAAVTTRWVHAVASPIAVAMELLIAVGLWSRRWRLAAVWTALFFHVSIELSASVEVFSVAAIAGLAIWATPSSRDRVVVVDDARWVRRLDWLARFEVRQVPGATLQVVDRDGTVHRGADAHWLLRSRLPLLFPFVAPARAIALARGRVGR